MPLRFKTFLAAASLSALALSSSVQAHGVHAAAESSGSAQAATPVDNNWGNSGLQVQYVDKAVKAGDDFNKYVNGKWIVANPIPADKSRHGSFNVLNDMSEERIRGILESLAAAKPAVGSDEARIGGAYAAFTNVDAINAKGLAPLQSYLAKIKAATTPMQLMALFAQPGFASPIAGSVNPDLKQSDVNAFYLSQGSMGLPDRDYYLKQDARSQEIRGKYVEYLTFLFGKLGYADAAGTAKAVLALETRMAQEQWDRVVRRNTDLTYNKLSVQEVEQLGRAGELRAFFSALGVNPTYVIAEEIQPTNEELKKAGIDQANAKDLLGGGLSGTMKLLHEVPVATWQAWMQSRFVSDHASVLPSDIDNASFDFYGKVLSGQPEQRPRWKRGIATVEDQVGELLGKMYAAKYYPPEQKVEMEKLIANLRKAMAANLHDLAWMGPETRKEAEAKLDAFVTKIGAPDVYKTYTGLEISADDALGNALAAQAWQQKDTLERIGKPVDRNEWFMLPQTVNAYYNPPMNEIVFPAGILQPPFFNLSADPAVNYGGIGSVIGHEIGHGFDDQGAKYDGTGNLRDWWSASDKANFEKLQQKLEAQYNAFCPFDEGKTCVNGKLTMGENIGDVGGLSLAYRAYKLSLNGKPAPVIDGLTGDQRFFMAWAQVWRQNIREEQARQFLITDPHSPADVRINAVVRNFDEWYKAFNVKKGDKLYLAPEDRVRIW